MESQGNKTSFPSAAGSTINQIKSRDSINGQTTEEDHLQVSEDLFKQNLKYPVIFGRISTGLEAGGGRREGAGWRRGSVELSRKLGTPTQTEE